MGEVALPDGLRLNVGCGDTIIEGVVGIDRKHGGEAVPLTFNNGERVTDNSVSDIRCSHMIEHLSVKDAIDFFKECHRVLKPGGRLRVAVPDAKKILESMDTDENWQFHLMGGQTDPDNFHHSAYDHDRLYAHFRNYGFDSIRKWESPNTDTAAHACSLNLEGFKAERKAIGVKVTAITSIPRVGWNDHWGCMQDALRPKNIPIRRFTGAFWGQCLQRMLRDCVNEGVDWVLCIDYDTMFSAEHVDKLFEWFGNRPDIDALAPLQAKRSTGDPLMSIYGTQKAEVTGQPILCTTAHFGLTLLRLEALKKVPKPWLWSTPDDNGEWDDDRMDDDIYFWHKWRQAGNNIYVAPDVRVGHLELMVSQFTPDMVHERVTVPQWREAQKAGAA